MEYDAGEERDVKPKKKRFEIEAQREEEELKHLLANEGNRAFLWRLLAYCRMFHSTSVEGFHMPVQSGMRDVGIWVFKEIEKADPEAFHKMHIEALKREGKIDD